MSTPRTKVRETPRISVNGLAEYLVAGAGQRRRIIEEQKRPRPFRVIYYREVEEAIRNFVVSEERDAAALRRAASQLRAVTGESEWETTRRLACAEAIECFLRMVGALPFGTYQSLRGPNNARSLVIAGVTVSVRPEILLSVEREGARRIGAVKLYFSKSDPVTEEQARYAGALIHQHIDSTYPRMGAVDHRMCFVIDVFGEKVFSAPASYKRRRSDMEAACEEIARAWAVT